MFQKDKWVMIKLIINVTVLSVWALLFLSSVEGVDNSNSSWGSINKEVFVASILKNWGKRHKEIPLNIGTPVPSKLSSVIPKDDHFMIAGVLGYLSMGASFLMNDMDHKTEHELLNLSHEELETNSDFKKLPQAHQELLAWMLSQEDESIRPDEFFVKTLEIMKGDVFKALLLGWDLLSLGWHTDFQERDFFKKTKKLGFMPHTPGDKFAGWYHFWGMMLYSFYFSSQTNVPLLTTGFSTLWSFIEEFFCGLINTVKERSYVDFVYRFKINVSAGQAGQFLYREIRRYNKNPGKYLQNIKDTQQLFKPSNAVVVSCLNFLRSIHFNLLHK